MTDTTNGNKIIAEYKGYKLMPCNNGVAWESPYRKSVDDVLNLHGRLFNESVAGSGYLKFHEDWNWIMPVAIDISRIHNIDCIAKRYTIREIFDDVVEAIKFINSHKK